MQPSIPSRQFLLLLTYGSLPCSYEEGHQGLLIRLPSLDPRHLDASLLAQIHRRRVEAAYQRD